jgi:uncharacterized membrane protein YvbJ
MNCKNCNESIAEKALFCRNCGSKVTRESSPIIKNEKAKKFWKFILYLALIIGGIALIVALGPLWIIAIILFLMLPIFRNK